MNDQRSDLSERLNCLWDAALGHGLVEPAADAEFAETISALHAVDDAPEPDPIFLAGLKRELLTTGAPVPARASNSARTLGLISPAPAMLPRRVSVRLAVAAIAAALIVAALSGGGRWLSGTGPAPLVASAMASSVPVQPTVASTSTSTMFESEWVPFASSADGTGTDSTHSTVVPGISG